MSKKILLVEDDNELRELYALLLRDHGYEITEAVDGEAGLQEISKGGYDLVLLDIMLPFMDGLDIIRTIVKKGGTPTQSLSSIVLLTNLSQDQIVSEALELGVKGYLIKSDYNPEQLLEIIDSFFA